MTTQTTQQAEFEARNAEAETLSAVCPVCGSDCDVHAEFMQATRREPMRFLGFSAICMGDCFNPIGGGQFFTPTEFQTRLVAS